VYCASAVLLHQEIESVMKRAGLYSDEEALCWTTKLLLMSNHACALYRLLCLAYTFYWNRE